MARQRKKKKMIVPLDIELDLPKDIIQHIQSFMDVKQAAGTCLLSKSWYQAWSTRPILAFPVRIKRKTATIEKDAAIRKSIISGMKKYKKSNMNLQKLDFRFHVLYSDKYARLVDNYGSLLDELIRDASDLGVKELHLDGSSNLCVPDRVFAMTSLNKLSIQRCTIKKWPIHNILELVSLRITSVSVGLGEYDRMIQDILLQCPSIEDLDLEHVGWGGTINLGGMHSLVYLRVQGGRPSVSFEPITSGGLVNNVPEFHKLRSICLIRVRIEGSFFTDFSSRFPCIEDLSLKHCGGYEENIQISSKSLKYLNLDLEDVNCVPSINLGELHNLVSVRVRYLNGRDRTKLSFDSVTNGGLVNSVLEFHKLRSICLIWVRIEGGFFIDFSSRFPCIEDLSLNRCGGYEGNIQISSKSLRYLNLEPGPERLEKAEFDVPNIRKFGLKSYHLPALSLSIVSMECESKLEFSVYSGPVGASWFVRLGGFLKRLSKSRISLHLNINPGMDVSGHHLPCSPTTLVENLTVNNYSLQAQTFLAALIVCFRPTCITLIPPHSHMSDSDIIEFVEHTDQELFANQKNATICSSLMENLITYPFKKFEYQTSEGEWRTIKKEKNCEEASLPGQMGCLEYVIGSEEGVQISSKSLEYLNLAETG